MEGERVQKAPGGGKKWIIAAAAVVAVVLCAYLGLCAWAGAQGVMPRVTVGGLDISGMSAEQAAQVLEEAVQAQKERTVVTLR